MENSYALACGVVVSKLIDMAIVLNQISDLQTLECSFVDSSGCRNFYFVAHGEQIQAVKNKSKFTFHVFLISKIINTT